MKFCRSSTCVTEYPNRIFNFETWKRFNLTKRKKTENLTNIIDDYRLFSENGIIFSSLPRFRRPFSLVWCAVRRRSMTEIDGILKGRKSKLNKIKSGGNWFVCVCLILCCAANSKSRFRCCIDPRWHSCSQEARRSKVINRLDQIDTIGWKVTAVAMVRRRRLDISYDIYIVAHPYRVHCNRITAKPKPQPIYCRSINIVQRTSEQTIEQMRPHHNVLLSTPPSIPPSTELVEGRTTHLSYQNTASSLRCIGLKPKEKAINLKSNLIHKFPITFNFTA